MSEPYNGPDDWTIFHIADDRETTYSLKNSGSSSETARSTQGTGKTVKNKRTSSKSSKDSQPSISKSTTK